jgi:hypothetical protein
MRPRLQKIILILLIMLTFVTVGSMSFLEEYFYRTRPRLPDPKTGRIYVENVKSSRGVARVYLTRAEKIPFDYIWYVNPILCIAGFVMAVVLVLEKRRRQMPPSTK